MLVSNEKYSSQRTKDLVSGGDNKRSNIIIKLQKRRFDCSAYFMRCIDRTRNPDSQRGSGNFCGIEFSKKKITINPRQRRGGTQLYAC